MNTFCTKTYCIKLTCRKLRPHSMTQSPSGWLSSVADSGKQVFIPRLAFRATLHPQPCNLRVTWVHQYQHPFKLMVNWLRRCRRAVYWRKCASSKEVHETCCGLLLHTSLQTFWSRLPVLPPYTLEALLLSQLIFDTREQTLCSCSHLILQHTAALVCTCNDEAWLVSTWHLASVIPTPLLARNM